MIEQNPMINSMIESSLYRCGIDSHLPSPSELSKLPEVSHDDIIRCQSHVTGHIRLMRKSSPDYFRQQAESLAANNACLMYIHNSYDIFGRFGNKELLRELKEKNIFTGANLSEDRVGTNAAIMASRSSTGVWVIGEQNYADALKPYACYSFQIDARYDRNGILMMLTPVENLSEKTIALFKLLESTEKIITVGDAAEDVKIKDLAVNSTYDTQNTDRICLIVDADGTITYVNHAFCSAFGVHELDIISTDLEQVSPAISQVFRRSKAGGRKNTEEAAVTINGQTKTYNVECMLIDDKKDQLSGCIIVLKKSSSEKNESKLALNGTKYTFDNLVGSSENFTRLKQFAEKVAATDSSVLIQGESGTGKELFAHAIHNASARKNGKFIAVNCAAIPKELIGSELFGYVPGSFTGASKTGAKGKFELANHGTLFLDEIGEMPLEMQSVLLRVLEDKEITRIGASSSTTVDIRVIAATNRDLSRYVKEGKFRADLYYRLNVVSLVVMPVRERKSDIPALAELYLNSFAHNNGMGTYTMTPSVLKHLMEYDWPGNVREIKNVMERSVIISKDGKITPEDLPVEITAKYSPELPASESSSIEISTAAKEGKGLLPELVDARRREIAEHLLKEHNGNKTLVAEIMGVSRSTLYRILKP